MIRSVFFIALIAASPLPLQAAEVRGRFVLEKVEDGYLRFDRESGAIAHCALQSGQWECRAVKDQPSALTAENIRLRAENEELKARLANTYAITLPSDRDLSRLKMIFGNIADEFADFVSGLTG